MTLASANAFVSRGQSLAIIAYLAVVLTFATLTFCFLGDLWTKSSGIEQAQGRLDQLEDRSRHSPTASPASDRSPQGDPFLDGTTITVAGAVLEQRIGAAVAKAGGALTSSQVEFEGPDARDGYVSVNASIEVDQAGVQAILYDIEAGLPYLFVDRLAIQSPEDFGEPGSGRMRMSMTVVGEWRPAK